MANRRILVVEDDVTLCELVRRTSRRSHRADGIREKLDSRHGGFGVLIRRGMVDEVSYNDAGNQVTLTKFSGHVERRESRHKWSAASEEAQWSSA